MSVAMSYELMITLNEPWIVIKQHQHELRCLVHQDHYVQRLICEFSVKNQPLSASVSALDRKQAHFVKRMASFYRCLCPCQRYLGFRSRFSASDPNPTAFG